MVAAHAYQAKIGFDSLAIHAPASIEDANAKDIIYAGVDGAYALAMSAVTLRQADLMRKVGSKHANWLRTRKKVPEEERIVEKRDYKHKKIAMALAVTATLAGQIAESVSHADALVQEYQNKRNVNEMYEDQKYDNDMHRTNRVYILPNDQHDPAFVPRHDYSPDEYVPPVSPKISN